jgi:CBS domain-containing protein
VRRKAGLARPAFPARRACLRFIVNLEKGEPAMLCKDLMKSDVECVSPADTVQDAAARMRDENLGFLPVCEESNKVLGTITDRDIAIRIVAAGKSASTQIEDAMTREVVSCRPNDDLERAQQMMAKSHKSRIMCLDDGGRLVGVISLSDIVQHEQGGADTLRKVSEREARV